MISRLFCQECGKSVSTEFEPIPTDTPDKGIIVRAIVMCPECFERLFFPNAKIDKVSNKKIGVR
jgi:hypothetical protein